MSLAIAPVDRKPCALETAQDALGGCPVQEARPCALLCATAPGAPAAPVPPPAPAAPPEDESADPVGDGHSDAEWAQRHPGGH